MDLGCAEFCLPGGFEKKLAYLEERGLWLELVHREPRDLGVLNSYGVEVKSVQAYMLHEYPLLSMDKAIRENASAHVLDTIRLAKEIGAGSVLVVPTYGFEHMENAREECISALRNFAEAEAGIEILVEPLDPKRTSFLPSASQVGDLVREVQRSSVAMALDTLHIHEGGGDPASAIAEYSGIAREVHLRDSGSGPPGMGFLDFRGIIKAAAGKRLCLEFISDDAGDLDWALKYIESIST